MAKKHTNIGTLKHAEPRDVLLMKKSKLKNPGTWALTCGDDMVSAFRPVSSNEMKISLAQNLRDDGDDFEMTINLSLAKRYLKALERAVEYMEANNED